MTTQQARRRLLKGAATGVLASALPTWHLNALAQSGTGLEDLGSGLFLLQGLAANALALRTDGGLLLVDSGGPDDGQALRAALAELDGAVHTLVNTHYHLPQTGGNALLAEQGARIVAHENTRIWMSTPYWVPAEDRYEDARPDAARPTTTFYEKDALELGGQSVQLGLLTAAHTTGDIYVHFPEHNLIAVGDVLSPVADLSFDYFTGGWIGGRRDALDSLLAMSDENTRIVPSIGPVVSRRELQAEREMVGFLYERSVDLMREGYGPQEMLDTGIMDGLLRTFDDPYRFMYDLCKGLWAHHNKLAPNIV